VQFAHSAHIGSDQTNPISAEVLTAALKRANDACEYYLVGPRYTGCRVDPVPDLEMAALMLSVGERLRAQRPAAGSVRPKDAWRRETARLAHLSSQVRIQKPAQVELVQHFADRYTADCRRERWSAPVVPLALPHPTLNPGAADGHFDLGASPAAGTSTPRPTDAGSSPGFHLVVQED
jgi:hypothetical protein